MEATKRYQLKLEIDEALRQYNASAVAWVTYWSELRILKYDHPYSADRSIVADWFIKDEADWQAKQVEIEQTLKELAQLIGRKVRLTTSMLPEDYEDYVGRESVVIRRFGDGRIEVQCEDRAVFILSEDEIE